MSPVSGSKVIQIKPFHYIHILDTNTGITRLEVGPQRITLNDQEEVALDATRMVVVPPRHYVIVDNPVIMEAGEEGEKPSMDEHGQVRLRQGDKEIRLERDPFPLYPGEALASNVTPLKVVRAQSALRLQALRDFTEKTDGAEIKRTAGDEWLFKGPGTYTPRVEVKIVESIDATIIGPNEALLLEASEALTDQSNTKRKAGERWLVREQGAYLPGVYEKVIEITEGRVLTERKALHLRATRSFTVGEGDKKVEHKAGDEWLVTIEDTDVHIPDVYERVVGEVPITTLSDRQWCVVVNPIGEDGKPQLGLRELRQGRKSFFLRPGEELEDGVKEIYVLGKDEALLLTARDAFTDGEGEQAPKRQPGDRWLVKGPAEYIPPVEVQVKETRRAIPLGKNEGRYVRNNESGEVQLVRGPKAYMLEAEEELWEKELPDEIEELLWLDPIADRNPDLQERARERGRGRRSMDPDYDEYDDPRGSRQRMSPGSAGTGARDKTHAVTFRVPQNAACQIHDYKEGKARVEFGPVLVMLGPDEHFTLLSLSGGKPKQAGKIRALALNLGPDFMTDYVDVETSDHALLRLKLSYNWHFNRDPDHSEKLFSVLDFVGDACKAIASRVRGAVAGITFDEFHKNSARIIRKAVFGLDEAEKVRDEMAFKANGLVITNVDIKSVEPVDTDTKAALQSSVKKAIQITTQAQEAAAQQEAARIKQTADAKLERQKLEDEAQAEEARKRLLELQAQSAAVQSTGQATAEAEARAKAAEISGKAAIDQATNDAEAARIRSEAELTRTSAAQDAELAHLKAKNEAEESHAKAMAEIDLETFQKQVKALGKDTIAKIAAAPLEHQVEMLKALGIKATIITDGNTPINLLAAAKGLMGQAVEG